MRQIVIALLVSAFCLTVGNTPVFAATTDTPTPTQTPANASSPQDAAKPFVDFATGMDSFMGGFIFYTPDPTANPITMKNGQVLGSLTNFKNAFFLLSFPIAVLLIVIRGVHIVTSENKMVIQDFFVRLLKYAILLAVVPTILSLSVQATNGLNDTIMAISTQAGPVQLSTFVTNYVKDSNNQAANGGNANSSGFNIALFFQNSLEWVSQLVIYLLTWLFLIIGMLFISFQMIIRFVSLMFLSVLMPIVLPFILWDKSEGVVWAFLKSWVTFLIHQPAFVLGFMIVTNILNNALVKNGGSVGMLLFYAGSLFFLGGVNVLASRIFGDPWQAIATNMQGIGLGSLLTGTVSQFGKGLIGGSATKLSNSALAGAATRKGVEYTGRGSWFAAKSIGKGGKAVGQKVGGLLKPKTESTGDGGGITSGAGTGTKRANNFAPKEDTLPSFTEVMQGKGLTTQVIDKQKGMVSVSGKMYSYKDPKTGLSSLYPTRSDGLIDGIPEDQLKAKNISGMKVIDPSLLGSRKNPYNAVVTRNAQKLGKGSKFGHITLTSDPTRVKHYLDLSKEKRVGDNVSGVAIKRWGNFGGERTKEQIVRIFTSEDI